MSDKISIIVPVYNLEAYIERTVASIQAQTYQNLEIILVDDGSRDNSLVLLRRLEKVDSRIKVISQENAGVTCARIAGVEAATGEWIGFVDGDDLIDPDMYDRLLSNALKYGADISHCGYQMVFPSRVDYYYNTGLRAEHDKITGLQELLSGSRIEPGLCNKLFHKSLFHSLLHSDLMDRSIRNMEDLLTNYYLFREAEKSVYEDFCPYHYMVRENSAATSAINIHQMQDPIQVFETIRQDTDDANLKRIIDARLLAKRINNATVVLRKNERNLLSCQESARRYIQKNLKAIVLGDFDMRQKMMATWVAVSPETYSAFHKWYAHIKGTDKKYSVV